MVRLNKFDRFQALCVLFALLIPPIIFGMAEAFKVFSANLEQLHLSQFLFFDRTVAEFVVVLILLRLLSATTRAAARIGACLVGTLLVSVYLIQISSLLLGGEFLSRLSVENIFHADLVGGPLTPLIVPTFLTILGFIFFAINKWTTASPGYSGRS